MNKSTFALSPKLISVGLISLILAGVSLLITIPPALAHHPSGGKIPSSFAEGFLSGLGHPVIGIDHLVFVIAIGLLAALFTGRLGMLIPGAFVVATALGTAVHLQSISLPIPELVISASVLVIGIWLAQANKQANQINLTLAATAGAIAGIFHGYAYGEAIVGAEATTLGAYLLGFCSIQLGISAIAFYLGKLTVAKSDVVTRLFFRFTGFIISGIGFAFLARAILS